MMQLGLLRPLLLAIFLAAPITAFCQTLTVMQLLQSPRQYEGRRVTVGGYYYSNWEGHAIFPDFKAAKVLDVDRSIWIEAGPDLERPISKARITGVFVSARHFRPNSTFTGIGHMGMFPAALVNCTVHVQRGATSAPNQAMERTGSKLRSAR